MNHEQGSNPIEFPGLEYVQGSVTDERQVEAGPEVRDGEQDPGGLQVGHEVVGVSANRSTPIETTRQGCKKFHNQVQQIQAIRIMRSLKRVNLKFSWKEQKLPDSCHKLQKVIISSHGEKYLTIELLQLAKIGNYKTTAGSYCLYHCNQLAKFA